MGWLAVGEAEVGSSCSPILSPAAVSDPLYKSVGWGPKRLVRSAADAVGGNHEVGVSPWFGRYVEVAGIVFGLRGHWTTNGWDGGVARPVPARAMIPWQA